MKKLALILLSIFLIAVSLGVSVHEAKAGEPVTCFVGRDGFEFSAAECDNYIITAGWLSTARGLANEFKKAVHSSISVEGDHFSLSYTEEEAAQFWWIMPFSPGLLDLDCAMPMIWANRWWVPLNVDLEPGDYVATYTWRLDHPVTDGWEACQPGEPTGRNIFSGTIADTYYFTITE